MLGFFIEKEAVEVAARCVFCVVLQALISESSEVAMVLVARFMSVQKGVFVE